MDFTWLDGFTSELTRGALLTLQLLLISASFGFLLAVSVALARLSRNPLLSGTARFYTSVLRARRCWCRSTSSTTAWAASSPASR